MERKVQVDQDLDQKEVILGEEIIRVEVEEAEVDKAYVFTRKTKQT